MKKDLHSSAVAINGENINHLRSAVLRLVKLKWITIWKNAIILEGFVLLTFSHSICTLCLCVFEGEEGVPGLVWCWVLLPPSSPCTIPCSHSYLPTQHLSSIPHTNKPEFPRGMPGWLSVLLWVIVFVWRGSAFLRDPLRQAFNLGINKEFTCWLFIDLLALKALFI